MQFQLQGGFPVELWQLFIHLLGIWCIAGITFWFCEVVPRNFPEKTPLIRIILLGLLTIYLMEMAPAFKTETIPLFPVVPLLAAMIFGPATGIGTGFLGILLQLLQGNWAYPADVYMPLLAAFIGLLFWVAGRKWYYSHYTWQGILKPRWAGYAAFFTQALYVFLSYQLFPGDPAVITETIWLTAIPSTLSAGVCAWLVLLLYHDRCLELR